MIFENFDEPVNIFRGAKIIIGLFTFCHYDFYLFLNKFSPFYYYYYDCLLFFNLVLLLLFLLLLLFYSLLLLLLLYFCAFCFVFVFGFGFGSVFGLAGGSPHCEF
jgi:hypothetical protein